MVQVLARRPAVITYNVNDTITLYLSSYLDSSFDVEIQVYQNRQRLNEAEPGAVGVSGHTVRAANEVTFVPAFPFEPNRLYQVLLVNKDTFKNQVEPFEYVFFVSERDVAPGACLDIFRDYEPVLGTVNPPVPEPGPKPAQGEVFKEPTFGTCVARVTNTASDPVESFSRHYYSRRQAFNADDSLLFITTGKGTSYVYNAMTNSYLATLPDDVQTDSEWIWDKDEFTRSAYFMQDRGGDQLKRIDINEDGSFDIFDGPTIPMPFGGSKAWTRGEGSPDQNLQYWCWIVEDSDSNALGVMVYDQASQTVTASKPLTELGITGINHTSMTPSGDFCVIAGSNGVWRFTRDLTEPFKLLPRSQHSDIAVLPNGDDAFVSVDYDTPNGDVFYVNLHTEERVVLFNIYRNSTSTAIHFSGQAYDTPGWVVCSTYANTEGAPSQWHHVKVFVVQLKATPVILQVAHHQSVYGTYWTEPHATTNRDLTQILFASNWGVDTRTDIESYRIRLPAGLFS